MPSRCSDLTSTERKERAIVRELIEVQDAMRANLEAVAARGDALEAADETTFRLREVAADFRGAATELHRVQFWRKWRVCLVLGALVLLAALAGVACGIFYAVCDGSFDLARCPSHAHARTPAPASASAPAPAP